jgi:hypothetical protein
LLTTVEFGSGREKIQGRILGRQVTKRPTAPLADWFEQEATELTEVLLFIALLTQFPPVYHSGLFCQDRPAMPGADS